MLSILSGIENNYGFLGMDQLGNKQQRQAKRAQKKEDRQERKDEKEEEKKRKREQKTGGAKPAPGPGGQPPPPPPKNPNPTSSKLLLGPEFTIPQNTAAAKSSPVVMVSKENLKTLVDSGRVMTPKNADIITRGPEYAQQSEVQQAERAEQTGGLSDMLKNPIVLIGGAALLFFMFKPKN